MIPRVKRIASSDPCCLPPPRGRPLRAPARRRLVAALKALADPTRLEIFRAVALRPEPVCVCEITARFRVSQPTISYHLKVLRRAGLVTVSRRGVWAYYAPGPGGLASLRALLDEAPKEASGPAP
ncbi:MAG: metalloregulator ArsR/SmtB family transcription factor [Planctomycetes bacterium]|nr:metalloregulator ArsR/SmtB family transcription factor [Planctomycetota bacterium]